MSKTAQCYILRLASPVRGLSEWMECGSIVIIVAAAVVVLAVAVVAVSVMVVVELVALVVVVVAVELIDWIFYKPNREGRGHSITATSEDNVKRVDELIRQDRRLKLHEIASSLEISENSAHRIVFDELGYRKVSARWVSKQLTDNHKEQRLDICRVLLRRSKSSRRVHGHTANAGGDFLGYDVT
ncbi:histone-lysine N-methyltransferase SETMAR [Elysia marginata]|uniref:Histone-lysine N-methyltransferase SETMAR n=1 Tax=Elysia marginata TaxID=1093978 RepID=A0AAV4FX77_9GAST|nr:histone-lysine N-methyltransferase SETMAR [Elysia marginata]